MFGNVKEQNIDFARERGWKGICPGCSYRIQGTFSPAVWRGSRANQVPRGTLFACRCPSCGVGLLAWEPTVCGPKDGSELFWNMHAVRTEEHGLISEGEVLSWSDRPLPRLHCLRLLIPNVYLITGERAVLIDAGGPSDVPRILEFLSSVGKDLSLILLTHGHWDHAGGAKALRDATKAPIALHRGDLELVRKGTNGRPKPTSPMGFLIRAFVNRDFPAFEPDIVIDDEMDLGPFGVDARVLLTPGHTPGSISVLTGEGDAIVGDLLMGGWLGGKIFGKKPGLHYFAEDVDQLKASLRYVLSLKPRSIQPGHGLPLDPVQSAQVASV